MSIAEDLDLLGAEGLSGQYIVLRVKSIDRAKLSRAIDNGAVAAALPAALALVDFAPQQALSLLLPVALDEVRTRYGVDLESRVTEALPPPGQKTSGTTGKVLLGVGLGVAGAWAASHFGVIATGQNLLQKVML